MICQNCRATVDNDLIFCTECGARLQEPVNSSQTILMPDSVITKPSALQPPPKSSSLKWIALIIALIAVPASLFVGFLLLKQNNRQVSQNPNKQNAPNSTPIRKTNQNNQINIPDSNSNISNTNNIEANQAANSADPGKAEIMNERIEIAPDSHYALPFEVMDETARITGDVKILEGQPIEGYVFFKDMYEQHFPDATYKVFSIDVTKDSSISQTLVKNDYVIVFVNKNDKSSVIQGNIIIEK
jgi:hypothetical protein